VAAEGRGAKRAPTEPQAAQAARQLHYHRERLRWILSRMRENEDLLRLYLALLDADEAVLSGGFRVRGHPSPDRGIGVQKLAPKGLYEQPVLPVGEREVA
jgi:hypothetical protein